MDKNIQKKVIDITGIELTPGEPTVCLGNGEQGLSVVATSATTICFVLLISTPKIKKEILRRIKFILNDYIKGQRTQNSLSFSCR